MRQAEVSLSGRWFDPIEVADRRVAPPPEFDWCDRCRSTAFNAVRLAAAARAREAAQAGEHRSAQLVNRTMMPDAATAVLKVGVGLVGEWIPRRRSDSDDPTELATRPRRQR